MPNINRDDHVAALVELAQNNQLAQHIDKSILEYYNIGLDCFQETSEKRPTPTFEEYCESERDKEEQQSYHKTANAMYQLQQQANVRVENIFNFRPFGMR